MNPQEHLHVYMSLVVPPHSLRNAVYLIEKYQEEWPQSIVKFAGLRREMGDLRVTIEIDMGEARAALRGHSAEVKAGYGFLYTVAKNLFHFRPTFSVAPTDEERLFLATALQNQELPSEPLVKEGETL